MPLLLTYLPFSPCILNISQRRGRNHFLHFLGFGPGFLVWSLYPVTQMEVNSDNDPSNALSQTWFMQLYLSQCLLASLCLGMRSFVSSFSILCGFSHQLLNFLRHRTESQDGHDRESGSSPAVLAYTQLFSSKVRRDLSFTDSLKHRATITGWTSPAAKRISFS